MKNQVHLDGLLFSSDKHVLSVTNQILASFAIATEVCSELGVGTRHSDPNEGSTRS
jgi:hypothetical protein